MSYLLKKCFNNPEKSSATKVNKAILHVVLYYSYTVNFVAIKINMITMKVKIARKTCKKLNACATEVTNCVEKEMLPYKKRVKII